MAAKPKPHIYLGSLPHAHHGHRPMWQVAPRRGAPPVANGASLAYAWECYQLYLRMVGGGYNVSGLMQVAA